jgi:hypothetical protein
MCEAWTTDRHHVKYLTSIRYQAVTQSPCRPNRGTRRKRLADTERPASSPGIGLAGRSAVRSFGVVSRWLPPIGVVRRTCAGRLKCTVRSGRSPGRSRRQLRSARTAVWAVRYRGPHTRIRAQSNRCTLPGCTSSCGCSYQYPPSSAQGSRESSMDAAISDQRSNHAVKRRRMTDMTTSPCRRGARRW